MGDTKAIHSRSLHSNLDFVRQGVALNAHSTHTLWQVDVFVNTLAEKALLLFVVRKVLCSVVVPFYYVRCLIASEPQALTHISI